MDWRTGGNINDMDPSGRKVWVIPQAWKHHRQLLGAGRECRKWVAGEEFIPAPAVWPVAEATAAVSCISSLSTYGCIYIESVLLSLSPIPSL